MLQLLAQSTNLIENVVKPISSIQLNWIGICIKWLIEGVGIIGVGIILFTLILKTIVLPLDIYSRVKTKKQSLIMEEMRPQMEKLQQQYANDKQMYSQKVMELQKKNGYSMLSACIPTIVSLVIFFVVFNAFSTYSQYANLNSYNGMVNAYNSNVQTHVYDDAITENNDEYNQYRFLTAETVDGKEYYRVDYDKFVAAYQSQEGNAGVDPFSTEKLAEIKENVSDENKKLYIVENYIKVSARKAVKDYYKGHNDNFLWVKNIWYPDSMLNKEIPDFEKFRTTINQANIGDYEGSYNEVTHDLSTQKNTYNGYFILILLAIGGMLLQQFITMKSQKSVNELSTVDGQGAQTNKMMMIMMPVIYGIFSFMYSAAFSIYMITNTLYSLLTTLIINKLVDISFNKKQRNADIKKLSRKK